MLRPQKRARPFFCSLHLWPGPLDPKSQTLNPKACTLNPEALDPHLPQRGLGMFPPQESPAALGRDTRTIGVLSYSILLFSCFPHVFSFFWGGGGVFAALFWGGGRGGCFTAVAAAEGLGFEGVEFRAWGLRVSSISSCVRWFSSFTKTGAR